jgi:hypothetical protein
LERTDDAWVNPAPVPHAVVSGPADATHRRSAESRPHAHPRRRRTHAARGVRRPRGGRPGPAGPAPNLAQPHQRQPHPRAVRRRHVSGLLLRLAVLERVLGYDTTEIGLTFCPVNAARETRSARPRMSRRAVTKPLAHARTRARGYRLPGAWFLPNARYRALAGGLSRHSLAWLQHAGSKLRSVVVTGDDVVSGVSREVAGRFGSDRRSGGVVVGPTRLAAHRPRERSGLRSTARRSPRASPARGWGVCGPYRSGAASDSFCRSTARAWFSRRGRAHVVAARSRSASSTVWPCSQRSSVPTAPPQ